MASAERPTYTQPVPPGADVRTQGGRRYACWTDRKGRAVRALVLPTGKCRRTVPNRWVGVYRDHRGAKCKTPTFGDRSAAQRAALDAERQARAVKEGRAAAGRPADGRALLRDQVADYLEHLTAGGTGEKRRADAAAILRGKIAAHGLTTAAAVDGEKLAAALERDRLAGRGPGRGAFALRTRNYWAVTLRAFGRWLAATGRAAANPFAGLPVVNDRVDRRRVRRALPLPALAAVVAAAQNSPDVVQGLSGPDRAALYTLAAYTGLRRRALFALTPESFAWAAGRPVSVYTAARLQKGKEAHAVDVAPAVAGELAAWLAARPPGEPLFRSPPAGRPRTAELLRRDLAAAGVPYRDPAGRVFDFHALRAQCGYLLASSGVPLVAAQQILDHSTPTLTANVYSQFGTELAGEVAKLPSLGSLGSPLGSEVGGPRRNGPPDGDKGAGQKRKNPRKTR